MMTLHYIRSTSLLFASGLLDDKTRPKYSRGTFLPSLSLLDVAFHNRASVEFLEEYSSRKLRGQIPYVHHGNLFDSAI